MYYNIDYTDKAKRDLAKLYMSEPKAYAKAERLIDELHLHPTTGTGHPEQLRGDRSGQWSRQITKKHRLIYTIDNDTVVVLILMAYGHYDDH